MTNFWQKLKRPFMMLAPMYDVTDEAFRQMFVKYGKPDVFFTEFVSVDGLLSDAGRPKLLRELYFNKNEHPIVAQVFGSDPAKFREVAKLIAELGFDGLDINMGCPDKAVIKQGAGSALIRKPELAKKIILAAKEGAGRMSVSVKTRIGYSKIEEMETWLTAILEAEPAMLTVHLRTMKEMSKVPTHWELAEKVAELGKKFGVPVAGNGDVKSLTEAREKAAKYNLDGVMIGRGAFGNPAFFAGREMSREEKLLALVEHTNLFEQLYRPGKMNDKLFAGHTKNFAVLKKHFKAYVAGWSGATALRAKLMEAETAGEVDRIINQYLAGKEEKRS
ncbi:MAG: tRNA-dihydrouridine synthase [Candidatus Vogelbacteria bacterium]|nr:tRNA-dihydrouridine synthase [Candidatus Vogelbacteria bacterium]